MTGTSQLDRRAIFIAQLRRTPEFQILNVLITDIHISPAQTVEVIVGRTETLKVDGTGLGNHFYTTACIILELAGKTTFENQAKLVAVVLGLHQITLLDPTTGEPLKYDGDVVWRELPTFGYTFVDEICAYNPLSPDNTPEEQTTWEKLTGFFAQLTARSDAGDVYTDASRWALTPFRNAFGPHDGSEGSNEHAIRAACIWLIYASERLWSNTIDDAQTDWSREEWERWKSSLAGMNSTAMSVDTQRLVDDALMQMTRAESGSL